MAKVKIDEAVIHRLFAAALEGATAITEMTRVHIGEEEADAATPITKLVAIHSELTITPRGRRTGADEHDFADVEYVVEIGAGEGQETASPAAITSAAACVAAALDEYTAVDPAAPSTTVHQIDLARAITAIRSGDPTGLRGGASARVTGRGECRRISAETRTDYTAA